jgi:hypothetical protein
MIINFKSFYLVLLNASIKKIEILTVTLKENNSNKKYFIQKLTKLSFNLEKS